MPYWFFMSYARADDQQRDTGLVSDFFRDLEAQVAVGVTDQTAPLGYIDHHELQPGDPWPDDLAAAVRNARTFLAVMTARYFTRPYCGSEWGIFEDRCRALGAGVIAPLIIPILWVTPHEGEKLLPSFATDLHRTFDQDLVRPEERLLLADYATYGLQYVMKRKESSHHNVYETILEQLAKRIVSVANRHPLPPIAGAGLPSLRDAPNRFAPIAGVAPATVSASNQAHFAFVAGSTLEMGGFRPEPQRYYGIRGPLEWMPYAPDEAEPVALIAQAVASERQLIVNWVSVNAGLVAAVERAEQENAVVIVIVDPWTALHPDYQRLLSQFDRYQFRNCVVLIPWNRSDPATQGAGDRLKAALTQALARNFDGRKEVFFRHNIEARADLRNAISRALSDLETLLAPRREPARKLDSSPQAEPPQANASAATS